MTRTFEIVRDIVEAMDLNIRVNDVIGSVLYVCNTLNLRDDSVVKDVNDNEFRVIKFEMNELVEVVPLGAYVWEGRVIQAPKPTFIQGKWMSADNEYLEMSPDTSDKTPLIWLVRGYRETLGGKGRTVKLDVEPLIYFLDQADFTNWLNEDHDSQAINPMYNLAQLFVKTMEEFRTILDVDTYTIEDEPRFGVKITADKGNSKRILSDDLSGVSLRVPIKSTGNCKNC